MCCSFYDSCHFTTALTDHVQIVLDPAFSVGSISKGGPLTVVPFKSENSFLRSEPGYAVKVDAVFVHVCTFIGNCTTRFSILTILQGSDFIRGDPSGKHVRLDVNSVLKDKSGAIISYKYGGIIDMKPENVAVLTGTENAKTTDFGDIRRYF